MPTTVAAVSPTIPLQSLTIAPKEETKALGIPTKYLSFASHALTTLGAYLAYRLDPKMTLSGAALGLVVGYIADQNGKQNGEKIALDFCSKDGGLQRARSRAYFTLFWSGMLAMYQDARIAPVILGFEAALLVFYPLAKDLVSDEPSKAQK